ncbi:MAG: hypothetical protein JXJ22_05650 [Bacteroidales bacterium]|nr:hypothetical protein [Bacteroidales bacterium]
MDNTSAKKPPETKSYLTETKKKPPMWLVGVLITLIVLASALGIKLYQELQKSKETNIYLEEEKTDLEGELKDLIVGYDSLKTQNDTINLKLAAEQEKIRKLLRTQAANYQKISMYKKELETLRKVMRSYIVQIDSLNTKNQELTAENIEVRGKLRDVEVKHEELSKVKDELSSKVQMASVLSAKNIVAEGINKSSKPKDKIGKIEKIRVCFTIRENAVTPAGTKTIYLRIIRPDVVVLGSNGSNLIESQGQQLAYTDSRDLEYENADIDMCIFWDITEELIPGTYSAELYAEGYLIGSTTFALK